MILHDILISNVSQGYQDQPRLSTDVALTGSMYLVNGDGCFATEREVYKPALQECKDNFAVSMNDCQTDMVTTKAASYQAFSKGDSVCVAFDLMPCPRLNRAASPQCNVRYGSFFDIHVLR